MKALLPVWFGISALGLMAGCGAGADTGGENVASDKFKSTLPQNVELGTLSAEESTRYCNELAAWEVAQAKADMPNTCQGVSWFDTKSTSSPDSSLVEAKQFCQDDYSKCVAGGFLTIVQRDCSGVAKYPTACRATVEEAQACSTELSTNDKASNAQAPECSKITDSDLQKASTDHPMSGVGPACSTVLLKCPAYFG